MRRYQQAVNNFPGPYVRGSSIWTTMRSDSRTALKLQIKPYLRSDGGDRGHDQAVLSVLTFLITKGLEVTLVILMCC